MTNLITNLKKLTIVVISIIIALAVSATLKAADINEEEKDLEIVAKLKTDSRIPVEELPELPKEETPEEPEVPEETPEVEIPEVPVEPEVPEIETQEETPEVEEEIEEVAEVTPIVIPVTGEVVVPETGLPQTGVNDNYVLTIILLITLLGALITTKKAFF